MNRQEEEILRISERELDRYDNAQRDVTDEELTDVKAFILAFSRDNPEVDNWMFGYVAAKAEEEARAQMRTEMWHNATRDDIPRYLFDDKAIALVDGIMSTAYRIALPDMLKFEKDKRMIELARTNLDRDVLSTVQGYDNNLTRLPRFLMNNSRIQRIFEENMRRYIEDNWLYPPPPPPPPRRATPAPSA